MEIRGQRAVVIGGAGDIGHATARMFADAGAKVILTSRTAPGRGRTADCAAKRLNGSKG